MPILSWKNTKNPHTFRCLAAGIFVVWAGALVAITFIYPQPVVITDENLEKFREITEKDPLFYDPAMDVGFLQESVAEMKHQDDLILYVDRLFRPGGDPKYRDVFPEEWRLWPDEFLETLPYIHVATKKFLDAPSREGALILLNWQEKAGVSYQKAIDLHILAMENIFRANPKAPKTKIIFLGSGTTPEIVYNDFLLIQKNALKIAEEIAKRKKCLFSGKCPASSQNSVEKSSVSDQVSDVKGQISDVIPFKPLPNEILGIRPEDKIFGPYWAETRCFGQSEAGAPLSQPFYVVIKSQKTKPKSLIIPRLTNERYYHDYSKISTWGVADINARAGIILRQHRETVDYLCSDLTYLPDLIIMYLAEQKNAADGFSARNQLSTLPYLIQNTLDTAFFITSQPQYDQKSFNPLYLMVNRSAYSLYFGAFSPAMWRLDEDLKLSLAQNLDFRGGYITYHELLKRGMTSTEITAINDVLSWSKLFDQFGY